MIDARTVATIIRLSPTMTIDETAELIQAFAEITVIMKSVAAQVHEQVRDVNTALVGLRKVH